MITASMKKIRAKYLVGFIQSGSRESQDALDFSNTDGLIPSIGGEHVNAEGGVEIPDNKFVSREYFLANPKSHIKQDDILLVKDGATIGKLGISKIPTELAANEHVYIIRSKDSVNQKWLYYLLRSDQVQSDIKLAIRGSAQGGLSKDFLNLQVQNIEEERQQKIAKFLDQKVARIDEAIAKKKKLMELLEEKRRRQITKVMTKGLNEKNFVESDIEWLGKIPTNYELTYLIDVAYERKEKNYKGLEPQLLSLSYGKIINKDVNTLGGLLPDSFDTYQLVKKGNIVLRLTDLQNDHVSLRVGFVEEPGMITSAYSSLTAKPKILAKYLYYYLHSADLLKVFYSMGGGVRQSMKFEDLKRLPIVLPDRNIQEKTINFLDSYNKLVDEAKNKLHKSIEFLEEYKTSLISNAVTGKVKI